MQTSQRILVAGAFLIQNNHVLLALRSPTTSDAGHYGLIGGKIEPGEAIHTALAREVAEETGLIIEEANMRLIHVISFKKDATTEIISFDFLINAWQGTPINKEPHKHVTLDWFPLNNLPSNILERHKKAFELHQHNSYYSYYGWEHASTKNLCQR